MCHLISSISMGQITTNLSVDIETQADGVLLEPKGSETYTVLIDGRWKTFDFTRKNLKGNYSDVINYTHF